VLHLTNPLTFVRALADMLAPHRNPKVRSSLDTAPKPPTANSTPRASLSTNDEPEPAPIVLPSSTELFYFYAQSLEQCAKLSTGQALFDLCGVQKKWLKIYAGPSIVLVHCLCHADFLFRRCVIPEVQAVSGKMSIEDKPLTAYYSGHNPNRGGQRTRDLT
jgi:hypothetical protein